MCEIITAVCVKVNCSNIKIQDRILIKNNNDYGWLQLFRWGVYVLQDEITIYVTVLVVAFVLRTFHLNKEICNTDV